MITPLSRDSWMVCLLTMPSYLNHSLSHVFFPARKHRGKAKSRLRKGKDLVGKDSSSAIHSSVIAAINNSNGSETDSNSSSPDLTSRVKEPPAVHSQLAKFLIHRDSLRITNLVSLALLFSTLHFLLGVVFFQF
ncbi:hypothetical protein QOT17_016525 [Balamuthia mandrillaris]